MVERKLEIIEQTVDAYAHLPRIKHPDGGRQLVDNPDLWFASKINATLKVGSASDVYWEKKSQPLETQEKFITGVRNHSWNRQHMGAMIVGSLDFEAMVSSLVSSTFALGKFYKMQQQTRRSVILTEVADVPQINNHQDVRSSFEERFAFYWDIVDRRPEKFKGFDPIIQDAFKILPLSTKTRMAGTMDLRTVKGYTRWAHMDYLPHSVTDFASKLSNSAKEEYPIMFKTFDLEVENKGNENMYAKQLEMIDKVKSTDLMEEPMLWYADHSLLLPKNKYFEKVYTDFKVKEFFKNAGSDALLLGYFNPLGIKLEDLTEIFKHKDEASKSALEMTSVSFISKVDISGGIDTWRHTRSNRILQPIYHALENDNQVVMPALYQRKEASGSDVPDKFMEMSKEALSLYHQLVKESTLR